MFRNIVVISFNRFPNVFFIQVFFFCSSSCSISNIKHSMQLVNRKDLPIHNIYVSLFTVYHLTSTFRFSLIRFLSNHFIQFALHSDKVRERKNRNAIISQRSKPIFTFWITSIAFSISICQMQITNNAVVVSKQCARDYSNFPGTLIQHEMALYAS